MNIALKYVIVISKLRWISITETFITSITVTVLRWYFS